MNNNDFRRLRRETGLDEAGYATLLGYTGNGKNRVNLIRDFESGKKKIPLYIARLAWLIGEVREDAIDNADIGMPEYTDSTGVVRFPDWPGYTREELENVS